MSQARADLQIRKIARELFAMGTALPFPEFEAKVQRHCRLALADHNIRRYKHLKLLSLWQLSLGGILGPTARPDIRAQLMADLPEDQRMKNLVHSLQPEMA